MLLWVHCCDKNRLISVQMLKLRYLKHVVFDFLCQSVMFSLASLQPKISYDAFLANRMHLLIGLKSLIKRMRSKCHQTLGHELSSSLALRASDRAFSNCSSLMYAADRLLYNMWLTYNTRQDLLTLTPTTRVRLQVTNCTRNHRVWLWLWTWQPTMNIWQWFSPFLIESFWKYLDLHQTRIALPETFTVGLSLCGLSRMHHCHDGLKFRW